MQQIKWFNFYSNTNIFLTVLFKEKITSNYFEIVWNCYVIGIIHVVISVVKIGFMSTEFSKYYMEPQITEPFDYITYDEEGKNPHIITYRLDSIFFYKLKIISLLNVFGYCALQGLCFNVMNNLVHHSHVLCNYSIDARVDNLSGIKMRAAQFFKIKKLKSGAKMLIQQWPYLFVTSFFSLLVFIAQTIKLPYNFMKRGKQLSKAPKLKRRS